MDVEYIQKINALALDLLKQGLAGDKEEAVIQAEKILSKRDYTSLNESLSGTSNLGIEEGKREEELAPEKIKDILEKNTGFVVRKMKEYQEVIGSLKEEVSSLREEIRILKSKVNNIESAKIEQRERKEEPQQKLRAAEKTQSSDHPRSGNYVESDVSIEKFFYSGSKSRE